MKGEYTDGRVNLFMPPFLLQDSALNDRGVIPNRTLADFYLGAPLGSPNSTIGLTPEYTHLRMGYDQHWNFGVQQQVAKTMVARRGVRRQQGLAHSGQRRVQYSRARRRAACRRGVRSRASRASATSRATSRRTYHALQAKFERRLSAGLWLADLVHVLEEPLEHADTPAAGGRYAFETGPSEYHVPHTLLVQLRLRAAVRKRQAASGERQPASPTRVLGGWQLQGS